MSGAGLKAVFLAERAMLLRLITARLGNQAEAEDALHDMWLKLEALSVKPVAQPAAYLYRMAANIATDRRIAATRGAARDSAWLEAQPAADELPDTERDMIARERWRQIEAAMAAMPERMSTALRLFRLEHRPHKEIAAQLGITVSGVEKLLQRAYRQIHDAGGASGEGLERPRRHGEEGTADRDR